MIGICEDLRKSVLQAAIQGRLTQQLPEDGDAESLYAEIQQEKQRLIKEGKIKKEKPLKEITDDDIPFDIPENWKWVYLGEIFSHNTGKALNQSNTEGTLLTYITTSNLYWTGFVLDNLRSMKFTESEMDKCTIKKGDLLVCEGGDIGRSAIWPYDYEMRIQNHIHKLRAYVNVCTKYYWYVLYLYKLSDLIGGKGIGIQGLSSNALHKLIIPLPPLAELKRIVARVDELMKRIDEMEKTEKAITALYDAFPGDMKAALLQAAIQGKLTEQLASDGDAETLYADIQKEKQRLIKEGRIKKEKPLPEITDDDIPFDIPENWKWVRLGTLLKFVSDGTHKTPTYVSNGIPFLSVQNISKGYFDFSKIKYISEREHKELTKRCLPQRSDILVCRIGTLGRAIKVTIDFEFSIFVSLGLLRSVSEEIVDWIIFIINSPYGSEWIDSVKVGGGTHTNKINLNSFPDMLIPLPPLAEQKRIVEKLDQLLPLCDSMKEAIDATA